MFLSVVAIDQRRARWVTGTPLVAGVRCPIHRLVAHGARVLPVGRSGLRAYPHPQVAQTEP
ncbi:hypothetical protein AQ490_14270 [Wenjunlia vitaminophila]|uniref:Uncharacterized protein n=1 Tax=Wenjunlia vitaminophila TaxID=76728 RepID=A0A0T6LW47_WENVI|nr:hypothetical protein AQ490_14270 [Wenjunlia vitaminophila]